MYECTCNGVCKPKLFKNLCLGLSFVSGASHFFFKDYTPGHNGRIRWSDWLNANVPLTCVATCVSSVNGFIGKRQTHVAQHVVQHVALV